MSLRRKSLGRKRGKPSLMAKVRLPCQAGAFYEGNAESLKRQIEECFLSELGSRKIPKVAIAGSRKVMGLVCPHAGYMFSGPVAAHSYYQLAVDGKPDVVFLFGPNHTGIGSGLSVLRESRPYCFGWLLYAFAGRNRV